MTSAPCSLSWTYDAWANRTAQTVTGGACGQSQMTINNFNKIAEAGYQYDPAGNMTNEPGETYQFDAENRISSINGGSVGAYVYDAGGRRVRKTASSTVTDYFYDLGGQVVAERQAGVWTKAYVYAGGQLVAQYSNATTYFVHKDHLGSTRMLTTVTQGVSATFDYQPFGESIGSGSATTHKFTGKERDDESGLDDFGARYYSSAYGRFMSADPPFIDQHPGDPQSWNLFAYVRNNPLKFVDPTGNANIAAGCIASCQEMEDVGSGRAGGTVTESDDTAGYTEIQLEAQGLEEAVLWLMQTQNQPQNQTPFNPTITYDKNLSEKELAADQITVGAAVAVINSNWSNLTDQEKATLGNVKSIDVSASAQRSYVQESTGKLTLTHDYVSQSSIAWLASAIGHDAEHVALYKSGGVKASRGIPAEVKAMQFQLQVGPKLGLSAVETKYLQELIQSPSKLQKYIDTPP